MASTYNNLGIELQATGENAGTWGTKTNTNLDLIAETWGYLAIDVASADVTLAMTSGSSSNARNYILEFTGTLAANRTVNVPAQAGSPAANIEKGYLVVDKTNRSGSSYSLTFKVTSATGVVLRALPQNKSSAPVTTFCYHNGTDIIDASKDVAISFTDGQYIADSNANELITFGVASSAVNEVKVTNAATGTAGPIIAANGESNVNLQLRPAGTGVITVGTSAANATVTSKGAHDLILSTNEGSSSGTITITDAADGDITLTPNGSGVVKATDSADATAAVKIAGTETMWIPANALYLPTTNPADAASVETTATRPELKVLDFDASTAQYAQFAIAMPKSWNLGTVTYQVFWSPSTTNTGNCIFGLQGVSCTEGDTADVAFGTAIEVTDAGIGTVEDVQMTAVSSAMTIAGSPADNDQTFFQLYRDAADGSDSFTGEARVLGIKLFYTTDAANDA
jgi:hypothetical protein